MPGSSADAPDASQELALLVAAAAEAAPIAMRYWRSDQRVDYKDGGSPVSEGDYAVDAALKETLMAARPDYGWLSEETEDTPDRLSCRRVFVVDPIDGTRSYVDGQPTWGISAAIVQDGQPIAGVVHLPARDKVYTAALGQGAALNGTPISAGDRQDPDGATVLAPRPALDPKWWAEAPPKLKRHWRPSLAYRFCLVAEGRFDAVLTIRPAYEWDIAAGTLIAEEAGARVSDRNGARIAYNSVDAKAEGVFTAPPELHNRLISLYTGKASR